MCTAVTYRTKDFYFGRNLDLYYSYQEEVTVTPRNFPFLFRNGSRLDDHYAMIGMATNEEGYPLYYDATNEKGLSADREHCLVLEPMADGLQIHENPFGVLTNNPPFEFHRYNTARYLNLTADMPVNRFSSRLKLTPFSLGMGSIGLPGDPSSPSRFVKAAFLRMNSHYGNSEAESISQCFHILSGVAQQHGITGVENGTFEYTLYSSCCNTDRGIYYYTTYENSRITAVNMFHENLDGNRLISFPLRKVQDISTEN